MLLVTTGAILITSINRIILPTVLPAVLDEFHLNSTQGGFLVSLSYLGAAIGGIALGAFGDSFGRGPKRAYMWGVTIVISIVGAVGTALSSSLALLQMLRVVMGIGTGSMEPINVAMISEWWQQEDRGFAVGTHHIGFPLGQFAGRLLISAILVVGTWRTTFFVIPLIAIPIMFGQWWFARRKNLKSVNEWMRERELTPSLTIDELDEEEFSNPIGEVKTALQFRNVRMAVVMNFLFLFAELGIASFLTLQLTRNAGLSLAAAAAVSGASGITGWVGQIVWGTMSDHRGRKFSMTIISVGLTLSAAAMIFISSSTTAWIILLGWGVFRNSPYAVLYSSVIDSVPDAAASGMGLMIGVGLGVSGVIVGPVAGYIIQHYGFTVDLLVLAAFYLATLIPARRMKETAIEVSDETMESGSNVEREVA